MKKRMSDGQKLAILSLLGILLIGLMLMSEFTGFAVFKVVEETQGDVTEKSTCIPSGEICDNVDNDCDDLIDEEVCDFSEPEFDGYIVELVDSPVATYKIAQDKSGAVSASAVNTYKNNLISEQNQIEAQIKNLILGARIESKVQIVFNGFSVNGISEIDVEKIKTISGIKKVYPNYKIYPLLMNSVPLMNADDVWKLDEDGNQCAVSGKTCIRGQGIKIGILDTGVDYTHPDLGGCFGAGCKVVAGWDFVNNDADPMDDFGHGTLIASIAAGNGDYDKDGIVEPGEGLNGVAPDAIIYSYKILNRDGNGEGSFLQALEKAVDPNQDGDFSDKLDVVSLSFGGGQSPDSPMSQAVDNTVSLGVVVVASAGNSGPGIDSEDATCRHFGIDVTGKAYSICSPGDAKKAITVGGASLSYAAIPPLNYGAIPSYSSRGPTTVFGYVKPDVVAPGGSDVCGAQWDSYHDGRSCLDDKHVSLYGTSFSSPHVSGAVALIKQAHPDWTPEKIKYALRDSAKDLSITFTYSASVLSQGWGGVDVLSAIKLQNPLTPELYSFTDEVSDKIDIQGNLGTSSFQQYSLEYTKITYSNEFPYDSQRDNWINIMTSNVAPSGDLLLDGWDTKSVGENGLYVLRLTIIDNNGKKWSDAIAVTIDNSPKIQLTHGFTYPPTIEADEVDQPLSYQTIYFKATATASGSEQGVCNNCVYKWYKDGGLQSETSSEYSTSFTCAYVDTTHTIKATVTDPSAGMMSEKVVGILVPYIEGIVGPILMYPYIYGDKIVWQDHRNGNWDVYLYNTNTHIERQITTLTSSQGRPAIYEDKIVWQDNRNGNWDVYMYDLTTETERRITTSDVYQRNPKIYGDKIVWQDNRNGNWDVYMYDLTTDAERQITTGTINQINPEIYENKIVWEDNRGGNWDIYMYDLSTGTERQITSNTFDQLKPSIYEDIIVWEDNRNGNWDVYMYDVSTETERRITTSSSQEINPDIYEDRIVWESYIDEDGDITIYVYDLSKNKERKVVNTGIHTLQESPKIYGDRMVWIYNNPNIGNEKLGIYNLNCLSYICGDANDDAKTGIGDIIFLVNYLFKGGPEPNVLSLSDVNSDGSLNAADIIYLINYMFKSGPAPICSSSGESITTQTSYTQAELQSYEQQLKDAGITVDITPPIRNNGAPSGTLSSGTTSTTISLTTDEGATCKYSINSGIDYASMTNTFSTTGVTTHSQTITGLSGGKTYNYYVKCKDNYGNKNFDDYLISFSISSTTKTITETSDLA